MFSYDHYVPVLKWKWGEQKALEYCGDQAKNRMTPLFEIPSIPIDYPLGVPKTSIDGHLEKVTSTIIQSWGTSRRFFLDTMYVEDEECDSGQSPLNRLAEDCISNGLQVVPVINLGTPDKTLDEIAHIVKTDRRGICLRVFEDVMEDPDMFRNMIEELLGRLSIERGEVDLLIDLAYKGERIRLPYMTSLLNNILYDPTSWRSLTFTSTSFPVDMGDIERDSIEFLTRLEWEAWEMLLIAYNNSGKLSRMPTFGDYCVANPSIVEIDPRMMNPSGHIRYTTDEDFLIVKGGAVRDVRRGGRILTQGRTYKQMASLCEHLVKNPKFCGKDFSWGDQYIWDCAIGQASCGNPGTWRRVATNHHLEFVTDQIANHPEI